MARSETFQNWFLYFNTQNLICYALQKKEAQILSHSFCLPRPKEITCNIIVYWIIKTQNNTIWDVASYIRDRHHFSTLLYSALSSQERQGHLKALQNFLSRSKLACTSAWYPCRSLFVEAFCMCFLLHSLLSLQFLNPFPFQQ